MESKETILAKIRNHKSDLNGLGVQQIGLFGSYARDEQTKQSDIDILIDIFPEREDFDNYMAICDFLEALFSQQKVDITTKNGLSPYIGPVILKEVVYA